MSFCVGVWSQGKGIGEDSLKSEEDMSKTVFDPIFNYDIDEFVVVGYGVARKKDLTGANSTITLTKSIQGENGNVESAIQGKIAGVNVSMSEGGGMGDAEITVRGGTSITGNNAPLYIVDGFPVDNISNISPSDIERIDVLKDAASAAVYGARAASGVVLVTTKKATMSGRKSSYKSQYGFRTFKNKLKVLSPYDYARFCYETAAMKSEEALESFSSVYGTYDELSKYQSVASNDWASQLFGENGFFMNQSFITTYKMDKTAYKIAYDYSDNNGIVIGEGSRRHNLGINLNHEVSKYLSFDLKTAYFNKLQNGAGLSTEGSNTDARLRNALLYSPLNVEDVEDFETVSSTYNPIDVNSADYRKQSQNGVRGDLGVRISPVGFLELNSQIGVNGLFSQTDRCYGVGTSQALKNGNAPMASILNVRQSTFRNSNTATFKLLQKSTRHSLTVLAGEEFLKKKEDYNQSESRFFPEYLTAEQCLANMSLGTPQPSNSAVLPNDVILSYFGRANYSFANRYLFSATYRADRSSKFAVGNQWGHFPSASVGWRINEEKFLQNAYILSNAKLRYSIGATGNNRISSNLYQQVYAAPSDGDGVLEIDGEYLSYLKTGEYKPNPDLTWETTISRNIGLDLGFADNRFQLTADVYKNTTEDLLLQTKLPFASGYKYMMQNVGSTENRGIELALNIGVVNSKNFKFDIDFNIAFTDSKVKNLGGVDNMEMSSGWAGSEIIGDYILEVGESIGRMYGYETDGWYTVDDFDYEDGKYILKEGLVSDATLLAGNICPGSLRLRDQNEDGIIDEKDKVVIGNAMPKHTGGLGLNFKIWHFDLSADFYWKYGGDVYNANKIENTTTNKYSYRNMSADVEGCWTYLNGAGELASPEELAEINAGASMWSPIMTRYVFHSWAVEDGSFLRLQQVTLGYSLPDKVVRKLHMSKLRVYATANNLFCWTKYSGYDPEVSVRRATSATPSVDYSAYPRSKAFSFGLDVDF
ncbi:MAG: SusC/RagA family TonB-linked outer membrane protein [Paludibacteraceae bacterium]|nr:SusC/RagA family TonB-linked outer membrane protein [Paludibacteraceae bacterium]